MRMIFGVLGAVALLSGAADSALAQSMSSHATPGMAAQPQMKSPRDRAGADALKSDGMRMSRGMMSARAPDIDVLWAKVMIAHHQGAIDMSQSLLRSGDDPETHRLAQATVDENTKAKADLEAYVRKHGG
ncbi:MAG: DUF305 domain-containing protein [Alphaproteobacteria bacterium]|nr:DUF305 domain-containing protein [Alphaproteobacteria bacterium]